MYNQIEIFIKGYAMKTITQLTEIFNADKDANTKSLLEYKEAVKYYHGQQLPQEALATLAERRQSPIIENIYKMIVNKILGYKIQSTQEVRVYGRTETTRQKADLLQEIIRSFNQSKVYDREIHLRDRDLLFGMGVLELWVTKDRDNNNKITLKHIPTESFIIDKFSTDLNALDSTRFHKILNINEAQSLVLDIKVDFEIDKNDKRAMIIESWIKEGGVWNRYLWHTKGHIYKYEEKPFKNGAHPFVVSKFQQDHNFIWYGIFRDLKPIQDYINIAENRMANMLGGSVKAFVEESAIIDLEDFSDKIADDNVVIRVRDQALRENKIHFIEHNAQITQLTQKTNEKRNLAKILSGLNEEALGMATNRQSGVAIAQRRDAGLMGLQNYVMQSDISDRILYEKFIDLVQYYYTKPQLFRITDEKNITRYFEINTNESNTIEVGEYDLIYTTQLKQTGREERFAHWAEIIKTISQMRPDIVTSLLPIMLKDTDSSVVTDVQEVLAQSEQTQQQNAQQEAQKAQQQEQIQLAQLQAQIRELEAKALKLEAQAQLTMQLAQAQSKEMQDSAHVAPQGETSHLNGNKDVSPTAQHDKGESQQDKQSKNDKANQELNKAKKQLQISTSDMR